MTNSTARSDSDLQGGGLPVAYLYQGDDGSKELVLDPNGEHARRLLELGWTEMPLYGRFKANGRGK